MKRRRHHPPANRDRCHRQPTPRAVATRPIPSVRPREEEERYAHQGRRHGPRVGRPRNTEEDRKDDYLEDLRAGAPGLPRDQERQTGDRHRQQVGMKITEMHREEGKLGDRVGDLAGRMPEIQSSDRLSLKELSQPVRCAGE